MGRSGPMDALKQRYPKMAMGLATCKGTGDVTVIPGSRPNMQIRGLWAHSPRDPEADARRVLGRWRPSAGAVHVCFGFGMGYVAREMFGRLPPSAHLLVIEPDLHVLKAAVETVDLHNLLFETRFHLAAGETWRDDALRILDGLATQGCVPDPQMVALQVCERLHAGVIEDWRYALTRFINERQIDAGAKRVLWDLWNCNLISNLSALRASAPVCGFADAFRGVPAVLVGAGPSLDLQMDGLRALSRRALILAVDTALAPLLSAGCAPDIVLATDALPDNYEDFRNLPPHLTTLVFDAFTDPRIPQSYPPDRRIVAITGHVHQAPQGELIRKNGFLHLLEYLLGAEIGFLQNGGSVITAAFDLAYNAGCSPVIFAGVDLAYPFFKTHSSFSRRAEDYVTAPTRFDTVPGRIYRAMSSKSARMAVAGYAGAPVATDRILLQYKHWLENSMKLAKNDYFMLAPCAGAILQGAPAAEAARIPGNAGRRDIDARLERCRRRRHAIVPERIRSRLAQVRWELNDLDTNASRDRIGPFGLMELVRMASFETYERLQLITAAAEGAQALICQQQAVRAVRPWLLTFLDEFEKQMDL